jgi:hypothetical protein
VSRQLQDDEREEGRAKAAAVGEWVLIIWLINQIWR